MSPAEYATCKINAKRLEAEARGPTPEFHYNGGRSVTEILWRIFYENNGPRVTMGGLRQSGATEDFATLPVREIFFTHGSIKAIFANGGHAGKPIEVLVEDLNQGRVRSMDFQLDVLKYSERYHSLNNRRLWALLRHQQTQNLDVYVRVRILNLDPVTAKFVLSYTTENGGQSVSVWNPSPPRPEEEDLDAENK